MRSLLALLERSRAGTSDSPGLTKTRAGFSLASRLLKGDSLQELELQHGFRGNHRCAGRMSTVRLLRCFWRPVRFDAARLYRDPASIHLNREKFHSKWPGFARI